ncbi:MAG: hypothetical protein ABI743_13270, partial [bacterium]
NRAQGRYLLIEHMRHRYLPLKVLAYADPLLDSAFPLLAGKTTVGVHGAAYVCHDFACQAPVTTEEDLKCLLDAAFPAP